MVQLRAFSRLICARLNKATLATFKTHLDPSNPSHLCEYFYSVNVSILVDELAEGDQ